MNRCLQDAHVPEWMTKGKTTFIQKDPSKGTAPNNYRPITCLPMMWKILTAEIREKIYYSLTSRGLFPDKQKGCRKGSSRITIHRSTHPKWEQDKTEKSSYGLAWLQEGIWYAPQSWILHCLKMYKISHEVINFIEQTMKTRRVNWQQEEEHIWNKDSKKYLPRRCTIALTIHNSHDATEMHCRTQTKQISREDQPPNVHGWHWIICKKWKRTGNPHTRS